MINAVRSGRLQQPSVFPNYSLPNYIARKRHCGVPFATDSTHAMDSKKPTLRQAKTADTMTCFGEGYATRSDEEGFGGIYASKDEEEKIVHEDASAEFDHNQGSEVRETEKARNQCKVVTEQATS